MKRRSRGVPMGAHPYIGAFGAGIPGEKVFEAAVLLNDDDDVLDVFADGVSACRPSFGQAALRVDRRRCGRRARHPWRSDRKVRE